MKKQLSRVARSIGEAFDRAAFRQLSRVGGVAALNMADFTDSRVTNPAQSEIIRNTLYDTALYPAAGLAQILFFQQQIGTGVTTALGGTVGSTKTQHDTNMTGAGTLPSGIAFCIESVEVLFLPGSVATANTYTPATLGIFTAAVAATTFAALNDINTFYQSGMLELNILAKNYLREAPMLKFPPKCVLQVDGFLAGTAAAGTVGGAGMAKATGRPYYVEPKILLQPAVNFEVKITWPAAVATPSTFNGRVQVTLDGGFQRASQ